MPLFSFDGHAPTVSPTAWIAPTATLVGDVRVEDEASIWYGAVLRADFGPIIVRRGANIQDGSVLHGGGDPACEIGEGATVGHLCVVHSALIGKEALIGNGATVLDGAKVGSHALVAAGATVPPGMEIPDGMQAAGVPARVTGEALAGRALLGRGQSGDVPRASPAARGDRAPGFRVGRDGIAGAGTAGSAGARRAAASTQSLSLRNAPNSRIGVAIASLPLTSGVTAYSVAPWKAQTPPASHDPAGRGCLAGRDRAIPLGLVLPAHISLIVVIGRGPGGACLCGSACGGDVLLVR